MKSDINIHLKSRARFTTLYIVRVAMMAALITALKFALSFVPNVEVITLLILVYGSAFGIAYALPAAIIFCAVEVAIYGMGSWVVLYFIYWPLIALAGACLLKKHRFWVAGIVAVVVSMLFGVLSACADTLFCIANLASAQLGQYWVAYYLRGVYFDLVHCVSNGVIVSAMFLPLITVCRRIAPDVFYRKSALRVENEEYKRTTDEL